MDLSSKYEDGKRTNGADWNRPCTDDVPQEEPEF